MYTLTSSGNKMSTGKNVAIQISKKQKNIRLQWKAVTSQKYMGMGKGKGVSRTRKLSSEAEVNHN